jgi:hypothetical protein
VTRVLVNEPIGFHAVAYLAQEDKDESGVPGSGNGDLDRRAMLMEWAIGKQFDLYRPNTGKLLLPGAKISWDEHIHAVGEEITDTVQLGIWLYPKGREPKYRTYLTPFPGLNGALDIPPNSISQNEGFMVLKRPARLENFQPHMHLRGKAMELAAILPDGTTQVVSYDERAPLSSGGSEHVIRAHDDRRSMDGTPVRPDIAETTAP